MNNVELYKLKAIICENHLRQKRECECCIFEDHCLPTRRMWVNGVDVVTVDEEHFKLLEKLKENKGDV